MKRKIILCSIMLLNLISCGNKNTVGNSYTVIWQNEKGEILEIDRHVKEGSMPSYDGNTPLKQGNEQYSYNFSKWEPEISPLYENKTYTTVFESSINKYTITWVNYNDEVLEIDYDVEYGTMPSYDSKTPTKPNDGDISYVFTSFSPTISTVRKDTTYKANFKKRNNVDATIGIDPIINEIDNTITYGFYPQTHVNDNTLISELNKLNSPSLNKWYQYEGEYYLKEKAKVYNNENYTFNDGTSITNDAEYWFKCEPITWQILNNKQGDYFLLSSLLLDTSSFYKDYETRTIDLKTIYANNYEYSDIRSYLNNEFFNDAFALNNSYIQETTVSNNASTSDNKKNTYACSNTSDKVYLPSYQDYLNIEYGFDDNPSNSSIKREAKTTDYARAKGAFINTKDTSKPRLKYNGSYWTRTPTSEYYYCAWNVNTAGYLSSYAIDGENHCIRPCITINL